MAQEQQFEVNAFLPMWKSWRVGSRWPSELSLKGILLIATSGKVKRMQKTSYITGLFCHLRGDLFRNGRVNIGSKLCRMWSSELNATDKCQGNMSLDVLSMLANPVIHQHN